MMTNLYVSKSIFGYKINLKCSFPIKTQRSPVPEVSYTTRSIKFEAKDPIFG